MSETVYAQLREALMSGKFRPGEALTLRGVAAVLGTSIMPVRDAILRLGAERALEMRRRGVKVPSLSEEQFKDILRFRIALEGEAAALAAERASKIEIARMEKCAELVVKAQERGHIEKFLAANQDFHFSVYRAARNQLLQSMIEVLWLQIGPHLALLADMQAVSDLNVDLRPHDLIIDAIKSGSAKKARAALESDLKDSADIYQPYVAKPLRKPVKRKSA
ncbi:MAG: GntR family transcriptional regulator [Proteobacteria bacterium]|nr:GntR family transcriptional regulator [Pseudomonadota bacterium]